MISNDNLEEFLEVAQDLKLRGINDIIEQSNEVKENECNDNDSGGIEENKAVNWDYEELDDSISIIVEENNGNVDDLVVQYASADTDGDNVFNDQTLEEPRFSKNGDNLWQCDLCDKTCKVKTNIKIHRLTHKKVKSFQCDICYKNSKTMDSLRKHKKKFH